MDNLPKSSVTLAPPGCKSIVLVVTDSYDQTQELALMRPVRHRLVEHGLGIAFVAESDLQRMTGNSERSAIAVLEQVFAKTQIRSIIFSRYTGSYWAEVLRFAQRRSIPTLVFLDDNLFEVPEEMGHAYTIYGDPRRRTALTSTASEADLLVASTRTLRAQIAKFKHKKLTYTPVYCSSLPAEFIQPKQESGVLKIGYMASRWHKHDLEFISDSVATVLERYPNVLFEVFGFDWNDARFSKLSDRIRIHPPVSGNYNTFRKRMGSLDWNIGIAPLRPMDYNMCKANTKWMEYICAGIPVVASRAAPYSDIADDAILLADTHEWAEVLSELLGSAHFRGDIVLGGRREINDRFMIDHQARQFLEIFCELKAVA